MYEVDTNSDIPTIIINIIIIENGSITTTFKMYGAVTPIYLFTKYNLLID